MIEEEPTKRWTAKRLAALLLTLALVALGLYTWREGGEGRTLFLLGFGVVLGTIYTARGGSLPASFYRASQSHWVGGSGITADDDPRNLSPKLYLPILLAVILVAAALYYFFAPRR